MKIITNSKPETKKQIMIDNNRIRYNINEICSVCGIYQPEGQLCISCQKEYGICKPKVDYR